MPVCVGSFFKFLSLPLCLLLSGCTQTTTTKGMETSPLSATTIASVQIQDPEISLESKVDSLDEVETELDELEQELEETEEIEIDYAQADPLEKLNKFLYGLHRGVDLLFIRPIALTYTKAFPKPIQKGIAHFISNLTAPLRFFCHLLQGNIENAGKTVGCFVTNTVLGLGGIFDVSSKMNLTETPTNFSETLKKWRMQPGPYLVVPGIGPTTFRNALGFLLDSFLDPVFVLTLNKNLPYNDHHALMWSETGVQFTSLFIARANIDFLYEDIENNSINRYSKLRGLVLQQAINR